MVADSFPRQQLPHRRVIAHADALWENLDGKMEVSENPAETGGRGGLDGAVDLNNGFRLLRDFERLVPVEKEDALVQQRELEIEAEFGAVFSEAPPSAFGEAQAVYFEGDRGDTLWWIE
jgi:hypothetical protein